MNSRIATVVCAAILIAILAPLSESVALAAAKRTCSCKPTLRRSTRRTRAQRANIVNAQTTQASAGVVGPVFATYALPANQYFRLRMNQTLNSGISRVGDRFQSTVVTPVYVGGVEVVPAGSIIEGRVTSVSPARTRGREGRLGLQFDSLVLPDGTKHQLDGALPDRQ